MRWAIFVVVVLLLTACSSSNELPELPNVPEDSVNLQPDEGALIACGEDRLGSCNALWNPVCGNDGKTYTNECSACANLELFNYVLGVCPGDEINVPIGAIKCNDPRIQIDDCVFVDNKVCGSDAKTYVNGCFACSNETVDWTIFGSCG